MVLKTHCNVNTKDSNTLISNIYAFQLPRKPQEQKEISYKNEHLTSSQGHETTIPKARRIQLGVLPSEISESNSNLSHIFLPQIPYSEANVLKVNYSLIHVLKNHQDGSSFDVTNHFAPNMQEPSNANLKYFNTGQMKDQLSSSGYILDKIQHQDTTFVQQENSRLTKSNSELNTGILHSKRMKKVPIVLITIQKEHNSQRKGKSSTELKPQIQYSYQNTQKHGQNNSDSVDLNSKQLSSHYSPLFINDSASHSQPNTKLLNVVIEPDTSIVVSNNFANNPIEKDNMFEYSVPQNGDDDSQTLNWKPMDGSRYKNFGGNVAAVGYSQEQSKQNNGNHNHDSRNIQNKSPFLEEINLSNQFNYKPQTAEHAAVQQPNLYQTILSKSGAHAQPQETLQESKQIAIDNSNDSKNRQQLLLPYKSVEEYNYQQQKNMDSGIRIQKQFQNVTFPTNIKENLNVLPDLISGMFVQTGALQLSYPLLSHPKTNEEYKIDNSEMQKPMQAIPVVQNQNNGYLMADYIRSSLDNSHIQHTSSPNKQSEKNLFMDDINNTTSQTETSVNIQIPSIHELYMSSNHENRNAFVNKDSNIMYSNLDKFQPFLNQNVQSDEQNINHRVVMKTPTNKRLTHSDGYIIFPLDDKYVVQNNGHSGRNYNIILNQKSSAYGPVKKLMMNHNSRQEDSNLGNFGYSFHQETENKNYNDNANLNDNEASSQDVNSNYNYNNDHSSAYDRSRGEFSNTAFNSATNSYANPKTNFRMLPSQMNTEPQTTEDANYGSGKTESIQSEIFQDSVSTHSESNEDQNDGFENFPKQFAMNYDSPVHQNSNYRSPDTQYVYQNMKEKTSANDAFRSLNQEVYNGNPTSNTEDGSSEYGSYYPHSNSRSLSGNSQMKLDNEPHQNFGVYSTNQQTNGDLEVKDLVGTSMKFSNSSEQESIGGKKPKKDILQPSTPEAVLLVLVSSKNTHPVNYHNNEESSSSEEGNESSAVKVVQLLKQDQNAKSLIESFYAKREENQESTDHLNQKYSPKTKKQK
ncbi:uncharacterized protein TNIN_66081 [Trichonephila inaurata madagascariensis]|uniref:Uncharacterized protein n=1 Tax=Trichonephila inaurata madagascariensis TaxID=2747483 RepID=A0A8X6YRS5_9ARAC|nr:uncharacterized protein TNIN_66081 [Trichonephila inaurata madagascariensis]